MIGTRVEGGVGASTAGPDDLDVLIAASRAEGAAVAAKLAAAGRLWRADLESGSPSDFVAVRVATALSVSTGRAYMFMQLGDDLDQRLPGCRLALELGLLDLDRVRIINTQTQHITDPVILAEAERQILAVLLTPGRCDTPHQVRALANRVVTRLDPDAAVKRRVKAEADREVTVRPAADGMSSLWGCLRAVDGADLDTGLRTMALGVCGDDPRTLAQARTDALIALVHGEDHLRCECGSPGCPDADDTTEDPADTDSDTVEDTSSEADTEAGSDATAPAPVPAPAVATPPAPAAPAPATARARGWTPSNVVVHVVVDAATLLGAADLPGVLARYGTIDPTLVRTLAADARWQRLLTTDGVPTHLGTMINPGTPPDTPEALRYTPTQRVADLVRTRDQHCRFPACTIPAASCDLDHVIPFNKENPLLGGRTVVENLACTCRWHHRAKTENVWTVTMRGDARQDWTGPDGQHFHTTPTGMPPTRNGTDLPSTSPPVLPTRREPPRLDAPPEDFPPDDHPPQRWTPDGHWADDPLSERDYHHAVTALDQQDLRFTQVQRRAQLDAPWTSPVPNTIHVGDPDEPLPF